MKKKWTDRFTKDEIELVKEHIRHTVDWTQHYVKRTTYELRKLRRMIRKGEI